jgi:aldehyde:ferredoxin oxidoreductase
LLEQAYYLQGAPAFTGLAPQCWPVNWFSHSNFGGNFSPFMKFAGWDGIVIEGKSSSPVYINIIDDKVTLEDAGHLWGLDTWKTQKEIWKEQGKRHSVIYGNEWQELKNGYTIQRPAIITIGPAGENRSRIAALIHNGGSGSGQGGFGGVFGSKNLKAIAVLGTGSIKVAHPKDIFEVRQWFASKWPQDLRSGTGDISSCCLGCNRGCHSRDTVYGHDSDGCAESTWFNPPPPYKKPERRDMLKATDLIQQLGINGSELSYIGSRSFPSLKGTRYSR